ncbi:MAG: substrate-binding domain-containing protein [Parvularcula sp.]
MKRIGLLIGLMPLLLSDPVAAETGARVERAKEVLRIAGSSTVAPFALAAGGLVASTTEVIVSETGTGAGIDTICAADGISADATGASRPIHADELERCAKNGFDKIYEVTLGLDGIVLAQSKSVKPIALTAKDVYLAVAKNVPRADNECVMVTNRRQKWSDVRSDLPNRSILFIGPPHGSGTREMFRKLIMEEGARQVSCLASIEKRSPTFFRAAQEFRSDGHWVDGGEDDHAVAHSLHYIRQAIGIFGYSHLKRDPSISAISIDGVEPSAETVTHGDYRAARKLYVYATAQAVSEKPSLENYLRRFTSQESIAPNGILTEMGLIPVSSAGQVRLLDAQTGETVDGTIDRPDDLASSHSDNHTQ